MKILLDLQACQTPGSRNRGIGRYSMSLALTMVREGAGHEFWLLLNNRFADTIAPIRAAFAGLVPPERIVEFASPLGIQALAAGNAWRARAAETIRDAVIRAIEPDVVHVASLFEGLTDDSVVSLAPRAGTRHVQAVTLYDLIPLCYPERYLQDDQVRRYYTAKADSLAQADLLLGISAHSTREATELLSGVEAGRAVNISSAIDDHFADSAEASDLSAPIRARLDPARRMVMYTGGIDWRKNIEGLIQAFARLPKALRSAHQLVLVCHIEPKVERALCDYCAVLGLDPQDVVFTGFVTDSDLVALYKSCRLFVFPSLHEGFGLPVLEALRCGAVVVASNYSSIPEVVGNPEATFDPKDVDQITSVMARALTDEDFRSRALERSRAHANQFSWQASARAALAAMQAACDGKAAAAVERERPSRAARPRLAMVTPLPPDQSGIADYAAELLGPLSDHYDITAIWPGAQGGPAEVGVWRVASVEWFEAHAHAFDRVLYQFGNSSFHAHMVGLLRKHPGVVVMHDFYLSGLFDWMEHTGVLPDAFGVHLVRSHGRDGAEFGIEHGRWKTVMRYPCNRWVLERAEGVIVHSNHARQLADDFYGQGAADAWATIPLLKERPHAPDRAAARVALGLGSDAVLVCSFGHLAHTKLNDRLLRAWGRVRAQSQGDYHLVFVGQNAPGKYGDEMEAAVAALGPNGNVTITGFADSKVFETYLAAADLAVQLRTNSRGETSKAILDCMAFGVPVLINANGSLAEYPADTVRLIPDEFDDDDLVQALEALLGDAAQRAELALRGLALVSTRHAPETVAAQYRDAIEGFQAHPHGRQYWNLMQRIADLPGEPQDIDTIETAVAISATMTLP